MVAAFWCIMVAVPISSLDKETRPSPIELARRLATGALTGARIGVSLCVVGMMAQTLVTTGLGAKIAGLVEALSGGNLMIALIITMLASILLAYSVPPVAAYSLVAIVTVPTLIKMGVLPLSAHFFCFYFAIISALTPPVALGALAGAGIAEANYFKTGISSFKLAIAGLHVESVLWAIGSLIAIPIALATLSAFISR